MRFHRDWCRSEEGGQVKERKKKNREVLGLDLRDVREDKAQMQSIRLVEYASLVRQVLPSKRR